MKTIILGNLKFKIDEIKTQKFYIDKDGFTCECKDCLNYTRNFELIKDKLKGLDEDLGIDISKDVGFGMEELNPVDNDDHHLYIVPYYVYGEIIKIWPFRNKNYQITHKIDEELSIGIKETNYGKSMFEPDKALTISILFKTPLVTYEEVTGNLP